jgi:hypothetical protein
VSKVFQLAANNFAPRAMALAPTKIRLSWPFNGGQHQPAQIYNPGDAAVLRAHGRVMEQIAIANLLNSRKLFWGEYGWPKQIIHWRPVRAQGKAWTRNSK